MSQPYFTVMIAAIAKAGMEKYVKQYLNKLMLQSRQDKGCIVYNIHQSTHNPGEFMLYSSWINQDAFNEHNQTTHMQEFKHKLAKEMFEEQSPKTYWTTLTDEE